MGILELIFGKSGTNRNQFGARRIEPNNQILEDFDPIIVDPNKSLDEYKGRPPIIFENGLS